MAYLDIFIDEFAFFPLFPYIIYDHLKCVSWLRATLYILCNMGLRQHSFRVSVLITCEYRIQTEQCSSHSKNVVLKRQYADREHNTLLLWNKHCIFWMCTYSHKNVLTNHPTPCGKLQLQKQTVAQLVTIFPILRNPKVHYYVRPPHVYFLSQINTINALFFLIIYFNIIWGPL